jgi:hypothetical protein
LDLGSGSDYAGFIGMVGVPALDVKYAHNYSIIDYPLYHSVYETYNLVTEHMDVNLTVSSSYLLLPLMSRQT